MRIRKSDLAESDLLSIYRFGHERFGALQADAYANDLFDVIDLLAHNPLIGRERGEFSKPVRIHPFKAHVIVYRIESDSLVVVRVLHGRQNWPDAI